MGFHCISGLVEDQGVLGNGVWDEVCNMGL